MLTRAFCANLALGETHCSVITKLLGGYDQGRTNTVFVYLGLGTITTEVVDAVRIFLSLGCCPFARNWGWRGHLDLSL